MITLRKTVTSLVQDRNTPVHTLPGRSTENIAAVKKSIEVDRNLLIELPSLRLSLTATTTIT